MASPPPGSATSPPLALPRQRPTLALPGQSHRRKASIASTTSTPSAHPLRQTSFPPPAPDSLEAQHAAAEDAALRLQQYSPSQASLDGDLNLEDEFSDSEIVSAISGPAGASTEDGAGTSRKRKRGEKKTRGRLAKSQSISQHGTRTGSVSLVNGEGPSDRGRRGTTADADNEEEDDSEDDDGPTAGGGVGGGRVPLFEGGQLSLLEQQHEKEARSRFRHYMEILDSLPLTSTKPSRDGLTVRDMSDRYDVYLRAKLRNTDLRKLVNQTLSQSVPSNVVTVVSSYAKMFAGMLVESAREVQGEWMAVEEKRADGAENPSYKKIKLAEEQVEAEDGVEGQENEAPKSSSSPSAEKEEARTPIKPEQSSSPPTLPNSQDQQIEPLRPGGAGGLEPSIAECDRGPLLPDHLREALRRYKKSRAGGTVGFTGLSLEGREVAAARMGGRRLFR